MMIVFGDFDKSNDDVSTKFSDFRIILMLKDTFRLLHECVRLTHFLRKFSAIASTIFKNPNIMTG